MLVLMEKKLLLKLFSKKTLKGGNTGLGDSRIQLQCTILVARGFNTTINVDFFFKITSVVKTLK